MGNKLYVGNLNYGIDSAALGQMFAAHGVVISAQVVADRETHRSRGFGFVEMATGDEAKGAIAALNGSTVDGRVLTVSEARPQERPFGEASTGSPRRGSGGVRGPYGTGRGRSGGNRH